MTATHHRDFLYKLRVFFIEFNILFFIMICRQRRTHLKPGPAPAIQPAPQPQPAPRKRGIHQTPGSCPGYFKDKKRDPTATYWPTYYTLISQDTRSFSGCHLPFSISLKNAYTTVSRSHSPISGTP